jgi:hypothetical protein
MEAPASSQAVCTPITSTAPGLPTRLTNRRSVALRSCAAVTPAGSVDRSNRSKVTAPLPTARVWADPGSGPALTEGWVCSVVSASSGASSAMTGAAQAARAKAAMPRRPGSWKSTLMVGSQHRW